MGEPEPPGSEAYRAAGVDLEAGARAVDLIRRVARGAARPGAVGDVGGFSGLFDLGDGRFLSAATDGVGTKLEVARLAGRFDTVGIDLVAMSANDVVCTGAEPLLFLDYIAIERVVPEQVALIVEGVAEGCRRAGCALLGGETAEHPGTMPQGSFDLAGFCVGIAARDDLLSAGGVEPGDALVGLRSSGLHANGFSLIRRTLLADDPDLEAVEPSIGRPLIDELLEPTAIYVRPLLALRDAGIAKSAAHITGGGFHENVPRALRDGVGAEIDRAAWTPPPIFDLVASAAAMGRQEPFGVFNMGIGMVVTTASDDAAGAVEIAHAHGVEAIRIGRVSEEPGVRLI